MMSPVVAFVGGSKAGKTTLIEKLIPELTSRGHRVATVKHTYHEVETDAADKDSRSHIAAGSRATIISSPGRLALVKPVAADVSLDEVVALFADDYDIVVVEGFKSESVPKIEVYRRDAGPRLESAEGVIAVASDEPPLGEERWFSLDDVTGLAGLIEEEVIRPHREDVRLYADDRPIPLSDFLQGLISRTLLAIAQSLHGVGAVRTLKFLIRRKDSAGIPSAGKDSAEG